MAIMIRNISFVLHLVLKRLYFETIARFTNRKAYVRHLFSRKLKGLSSLTIAENMAGTLVAENGTVYIRTYDDFYLIYNCSGRRYTLGDGQSLDFRDGQRGGYVEEFLMRYMTDAMLYLDVGANNGYFYSLKIARRFPACPVYAFEPDAQILWHLRKNVEFNGLHNVHIIPQALCDFVGTGQLTANLGASGYLLPDHPGSSTVTVECNTLDNFVEHNHLGRIDLIKVDIEGGEGNFLKGATASITHFQPMMILELAEELLKRSHSSLHEVMFLLNTLGYQCYSVIQSADVLALPATKIHTLCPIDSQRLQPMKL